MYMKCKKWLILFTVLLLFLSSPKITKADNQLDALEIQQQIEELQAQIEYLQSLISNILLQKETLAQAYIAVNILDSSIIAEKNNNKVYPIASITKLMNAVISVEKIDMDKTITLNSAMLQPEGYSPSLFLNLNVSAKNLLQASLIQSTNDASQALSYFVGNDKFIQLMNQKAKELNMNNTNFHDAYGMSSLNRSTASDLAKLLAYIYKNHPEILSITKENDFWLPSPAGKLLKFQNVNNLYSYPEFIGAKSGYIPEAKQTLASVAEVNGKPVAIVLLHSTNRKTDALKIVDWIKNNIKQ